MPAQEKGSSIGASIQPANDRQREVKRKGKREERELRWYRSLGSGLSRATRSLDTKRRSSPIYKAEEGQDASSSSTPFPFEVRGSRQPAIVPRINARDSTPSLSSIRPGSLIAAATRGYPKLGDEPFPGEQAYNKQLRPSWTRAATSMPPILRGLRLYASEVDMMEGSSQSIPWTSRFTNPGLQGEGARPPAPGPSEATSRRRAGLTGGAGPSLRLRRAAALPTISRTLPLTQRYVSRGSGAGRRAVSSSPAPRRWLRPSLTPSPRRPSTFARSGGQTTQRGGAVCRSCGACAEREIAWLGSDRPAP